MKFDIAILMLFISMLIKHNILALFLTGISIFSIFILGEFQINQHVELMIVLISSFSISTIFEERSVSRVRAILIFFIFAFISNLSDFFNIFLMLNLCLIISEMEIFKKFIVNISLALSLVFYKFAFNSFDLIPTLNVVEMNINISFLALVFFILYLLNFFIFIEREDTQNDEYKIISIYLFSVFIGVCLEDISPTLFNIVQKMILFFIIIDLIKNIALTISNNYSISLIIKSYISSLAVLNIMYGYTEFLYFLIFYVCAKLLINLGGHFKKSSLHIVSGFLLFLNLISISSLTITNLYDKIKIETSVALWILISLNIYFFIKLFISNNEPEQIYNKIQKSNNHTGV